MLYLPGGSALSVTKRSVLEVLGRDELKAICRGLGLDDTGRSKQGDSVSPALFEPARQPFPRSFEA